MKHLSKTETVLEGRLRNNPKKFNSGRQFDYCLRWVRWLSYHPTQHNQRTLSPLQPREPTLLSPSQQRQVHPSCLIKEGLRCQRVSCHFRYTVVSKTSVSDKHI